MKKLLVLGSLPNSEEEHKKYETVIEAGKEYFGEIYSPINTKKFKGNDRERFERATRKVEEADLIIGELSLPSTGQGIELGIAYTLAKKVIIIAKTGSNVSGLIKGCPVIADITYYEDICDLKEKLKKEFNSGEGFDK